MDAFSAIYAAAVLLPIIFITALCISCRKKIPIHITETGYYDDKPPITPPTSSFMIINRPPCLPRSVSSQGTMCHPDVLLPIPRSPATESRRSSVGREFKGYPDGCDSIPHSPSAPILQSKSIDDGDYDDEGEDGSYSNDNPACGYIQVLPDEGGAKIGPVLVVTCDVDNRASLSSVGTDENYVNVGDCDDAKGGSLEYVNVEAAETRPGSVNQESEDTDTPDYENIEKGHKG